MCPSGTLSAGQTIDNSSAVRVSEVKAPFIAQSGGGAFAGNWQTANRPGI
jgi:hypothetical protein